MKAAVFNGKNLNVERFAKPEPENHQVLIRLESTGICGTDMAIVEGHLSTPTPIILGHELSGYVESVGDSAASEWVGKRVTSEINTNICGECYFCKNGIPTNCVHRQALGIDVNGAFAEYIAVDEDLVYELPKGASYEVGSLVEPLAAAINTFELMPLTEEDRTVVVFGDGKLGQIIVQVAARYQKINPEVMPYIPEVILIGHSDDRLAVGKECGADRVFNSKKINPSDEILSLTDNLGADVVIDCTGNSDAFAHVVKATRTRGKIGLKSTHGLPVPIDMTDIVVREINLYGTRCGPFDKAIAFLEAGLLKSDQLIGGKVSLSEIEEGFDLARKEGVIKVVIENQK